MSGVHLSRVQPCVWSPARAAAGAQRGQQASSCQAAAQTLPASAGACPPGHQAARCACWWHCPAFAAVQQMVPAAQQPPGLSQPVAQRSPAVGHPAALDDPGPSQRAILHPPWSSQPWQHWRRRHRTRCRCQPMPPGGCQPGWPAGLGCPPSTAAWAWHPAAGASLRVPACSTGWLLRCRHPGLPHSAPRPGLAIASSPTAAVKPGGMSLAYEQRSGDFAILIQADTILRNHARCLQRIDGGLSEPAFHACPAQHVRLWG